MPKDKENKDESIYKRHKRAPVRTPTLETDLYLTRKSLLKVQIARIKKLFKQDKKFVTIHGLGGAINKAVELAYLFREEHSNVKWEITTSSVKLFDDLEANDLDEDSTVAVRTNTAIHIKVFKPQEL
jgi:ribonuclease P/MRP protein subunit RPP20